MITNLLFYFMYDVRHTTILYSRVRGVDQMLAIT